jgi:hypothetical protein
MARTESPDFYEIAWRRGLAVESLVARFKGTAARATCVTGPEGTERIELGPRILEHSERRTWAAWTERELIAECRRRGLLRDKGGR